MSLTIGLSLIDIAQNIELDQIRLELGVEVEDDWVGHLVATVKCYIGRLSGHNNQTTGQGHKGWF